MIEERNYYEGDKCDGKKIRLITSASTRNKLDKEKFNWNISAERHHKVSIQWIGT